MFSVENLYRNVVDNFIILLVLKFDSHKSDRLEVVLKLLLQSVHGRYKKVVYAFLILLVLKFHNHRSNSLRVMNFTKWLMCSVYCQNRF
jgi:hypothetical protein